MSCRDSQQRVAIPRGGPAGKPRGGSRSRSRSGLLARPSPRRRFSGPDLCLGPRRELGGGVRRGTEEK